MPEGKDPKGDIPNQAHRTAPEYSRDVERNARKWRCCCGIMHVESALKWVGAVGAVLKLAALVPTAMIAEWLAVGHAVAGLLAYILVAVALVKRIPALYYAYMVVNLAYFVVAIIVVVLLAKHTGRLGLPDGKSKGF
jgi:hypothetical protein